MRKVNIGLETKVTKVLVKELNSLLATYQVLYMNVRGYHWNISGPEFFELHAKFEEMYNELLTAVDEIAERILTLGGQPVHAYSQYAKESLIKEHVNAVKAQETVEGLLKGLETVVKLQREILTTANDADDEGTSSMLSDYIKAQEKLIWQYSAFLN